MAQYLDRTRPLDKTTFNAELRPIAVDNNMHAWQVQIMTNANKGNSMLTDSDRLEYFTPEKRIETLLSDLETFTAAGNFAQCVALRSRLTRLDGGSEALFAATDGEYGDPDPDNEEGCIPND